MVFVVMTIFSDSEEKISICAVVRTARDYPRMLTHARMIGTTVVIAATTCNGVQPVKPRGWKRVCYGASRYLGEHFRKKSSGV